MKTQSAPKIAVGSLHHRGAHSVEAEHHQTRLAADTIDPTMIQSSRNEMPVPFSVCSCHSVCEHVTWKSSFRVLAKCETYA